MPPCLAELLFCRDVIWLVGTFFLCEEKEGKEGKGREMLLRPLRLVMLLVALAGIHGASLDRNNAFIGYSESSDGGGGGGGEAAGAAAEAGAGMGPEGEDERNPGCTTEDDNEGCRAWARAGECEKNPGYMSVSCALSCKIPCVAPLRRNSVGGGTVVMRTSEGDVRINLRDDISPTVANYFKTFAVEGTCDKANGGCAFYRSESVPKPGAVDNYGGPGPPYALVQGRLAGSGVRSDLPREGAPKVERGYVALIGTGPDFFIAVKHHREWGNAHTIWGVVAEKDMGPVDAITKLPVKEEVWGQTQVTVLREKLPFRMTFEPPEPSQAATLRGGGG